MFNGLFKLSHKTYNKRTRLSDATNQKLKKYYWPGNVRELANTIERLVIMAEDDLVSPDDLPFEITSDKEKNAAIKEHSSGKSGTLNQEVQFLEYDRIVNALKENNLFIAQ